MAQQILTMRIFGANELRAKLGKLSKLTGPSAMASMKKSVALMERDLKKSLTGQKRRDPFLGVTGAPPPTLGARSGRTRASVTSEVVRFSDGIILGIVGSPLKMLIAHEEGAFISGNQYLRIPLAAAQTAAGIDRNLGRSIRGLPGTFILKSKRGNLFVVRRRGRYDMEFLYLLKHSVRLPARHTFRESARRMRGPIEAIFERDMAILVRQVAQ